MLRSITFEPLVRWARNFAQTFGQQSSNCKQIFVLLPTRIAEQRRIYREFLRYFTPASYLLTFARPIEYKRVTRVLPPRIIHTRRLLRFIPRIIVHFGQWVCYALLC